MAELNTIRRAGAGTQGVAIDEGLRSHMNKVYGLMSVAMVITGAVAYFVGNSPEMLNAIFGSPLRWVVMFAPLAVVFALGAMITRMSQMTAQLVFAGFSALMGLSISYIFALYTDASITQTFFITAIAFASLSLWGYTTKKDISAWGSFLIMGVIGLIVASIVNIFLASAAINFAVSALGVLIFAGLTAYDTQKIKTEYLQMATSPQGQEWLGKAAIMGALTLYLDFLNMFMFLLQFIGDRR